MINFKSFLIWGGEEMPKQVLDSDNLKLNEDWEGNNVAFTCPAGSCGQVFMDFFVEE